MNGKCRRGVNAPSGGLIQLSMSAPAAPDWCCNIRERTFSHCRNESREEFQNLHENVPPEGSKDLLCHPRESMRILSENLTVVIFHPLTYPPAAQRWQKPARAGNRGTEPSAPLLLRAFSSGNRWAVCQWCAHLEGGQEPPEPPPCIPSCPSWTRDTSCLLLNQQLRGIKTTSRHLNFFLHEIRSKLIFESALNAPASEGEFCVFSS